MIDWNQTEKEFNVNNSNYKHNSTVVVICDGCGVFGHKKIRSKKNVVDGQMVWKCMSCCLNNSDTKAKKSFISKKIWKENKDKIVNSIDYTKISIKNKEKWQNEEYKEKVLNSIKRNILKNSERMKEKWQDEKYKSKMMDIYSTKEWSESRSKIVTEAWKNNEYRKKISDASKRMWENLEYKKKMSIVRDNQRGKVSSIQNQLYSILDDLNIEYYREYSDKPNDQETIIGPYHFDCVIKINNKKILIECQGDYWHSDNINCSKDKSKATYIEKYHKDCEIKYLWEHEFRCKDKIVELIKYWTGKTGFELVDFSFDDLEIRECPAKDYKLLLSKYHYISNAGRGGMAHGSYGAYLKDELIAVCVFSPLGRQNMPWDKQSTRELSRLCIHPRYQKKNFASWFVSRCIKKLPEKYKTIISYCDTTFNHDGATYKACNFRLDGEVKPDYWYVSEDGWVMHKKTLYNHATKMSMKEKEYAEANNYKKVYGKEKLRFVYQK